MEDRSTLACLLACFEDLMIDLHGLAVLSAVRPPARRTCFISRFVGKEVIDKLLVLVALLCELGQSCGRAVAQDRDLHQLCIELVAGQQRHRIGQQGTGGFEHLRFSGSFIGLVCLMCVGPGVFGGLSVSLHPRGLPGTPLSSVRRSQAVPQRPLAQCLKHLGVCLADLLAVREEFWLGGFLRGGRQCQAEHEAAEQDAEMGSYRSLYCWHDVSF